MRRGLVGAVVCLLVVLFPIAAVVTEADALAPARRQLLLVSASPADPTRATVRALEWTGHRWRLTFPAMSARLGRSGVTADPHEADVATPVGTYSVDLAFGTGDAPGGALPYRHVTNDDHWVDDPASPSTTRGRPARPTAAGSRPRTSTATRWKWPSTSTNIR